MTAIPHLISAGRALVDAGLSPGNSGNISVRENDQVFVSATGASLGCLTDTDFGVVSLNAEVVAGAAVSKETPLHLGFYQRDPSFRAVIHVHSAHATAFSCTAPWSDVSAVPPLTPYFVMRVGRTPLLPYRMPGSTRLGTDILEAPGKFRAALLANHGLVVAGSSLNEAVTSAVELEEACRIALLTAHLDRRTLTPDEVSELAKQWNSPW